MRGSLVAFGAVACHHFFEAGHVCGAGALPGDVLPCVHGVPFTHSTPLFRGKGQQAGDLDSKRVGHARRNQEAVLAVTYGFAYALEVGCDDDVPRTAASSDTRPKHSTSLCPTTSGMANTSARR